MKLDMFNIDEFIRLNHCQQVTNPIFWQANKLPTEDGLFSYEIFGYSEEERKSIFGYIDLNGYFIHPIVYSMLNSRMGAVKDIINGEKYAKIVNKKIVIVPEDTEGAQTGLGFIYDNFEAINWLDELEENEIESIDKKTRLKFLKSLKKDEFFVSKWLVLPVFYREERADGASLGDEINQLYKDLISTCRSLKMFSFDIFGDATKLKIQNLIYHIYQMTMSPITGKHLDTKTWEAKGQSKNSMLKRNLIGKKLDYGALTVITAPVISDAKTVDDMPVPFGYAGVTMISCIGLFKPFYVREASLFLTDVVNYLDNDSSLSWVDRSIASTTNIDKILNRFIKSSAERFDPIIFNVKTKSGIDSELYLTIEEKDVETGEVETRLFTYTDLLYIAGQEVVKNKHVLITRHPVTNNKNIYPARVIVNSTARTHTVEISLFFEDSTKRIETLKLSRYPYVWYNNLAHPKPKNYYEFVGTSIIGNSVLKAIGGDYDGDTVFLRGLFSIQANAEAEKIIKAKSNILGPNGTAIRGLTQIGKDCVVSLYELTKD